VAQAERWRVIAASLDELCASPAERAAQAKIDKKFGVEKAIERARKVGVSLSRAQARRMVLAKEARTSSRPSLARQDSKIIDHVETHGNTVLAPLSLCSRLIRMLCCIVRWADLASLLVVVPQNWVLLDTKRGSQHHADRWRNHLKNSEAGQAALATNKKVVDSAYFEMMAHRCLAEIAKPASSAGPPEVAGAPG
jgi:hypothetical protein